MVRIPPSSHAPRGSRVRAQLVERQPSKLNVAGSNPVSRLLRLPFLSWLRRGSSPTTRSRFPSRRSLRPGSSDGRAPPWVRRVGEFDSPPGLRFHPSPFCPSRRDAAPAARRSPKTRGKAGAGSSCLKVQPHQAARERRDDRSHRPRQDDDDGCDHEGRCEEVRRQRSTYADIAKGGTVRDDSQIVTIAVSHVEYESENRHYARRLPRPPTTSKEHDHGRGADGRRDPGGQRRSAARCRRRASTCSWRVRSACRIVVWLNKVDAVGTRTFSSWWRWRSEPPEQVQVRRRQRARRFATRPSRRLKADRKGVDRQPAERAGRLDPEPQRDGQAVPDGGRGRVLDQGRGTVVTGRIERSVIKVGERGDPRLP